jgi:alpha-aminoadipic semialdehyde synthase
MNEIGLDPGIDHLLAKRFIDSVHAQGSAITSFVSWCGGLPAPENSDNPLGYKFSWSPRWVLMAAMNPAKFKSDGRMVDIEAGCILDHAQSVDIFKGFHFEGLANRDSLKYVDAYGLNKTDLETMFRGTLRYAVCFVFTMG